MPRSVAGRLRKDFGPSHPLEGTTIEYIDIGSEKMSELTPFLASSQLVRHMEVLLAWDIRLTTVMGKRGWADWRFLKLMYR